MSVAAPNAIEIVVGFMDGMRRGDLSAVAECFDPEVTWRGVVPEEGPCRNREDVLAMLGDVFMPCPDDPASFEPEPGLRGAEAVELITPAPETVVLGAKIPGLSEIGGASVRGQLFNVYRVRNGRIVAVEDYADRKEAFRAAGAKAPRWKSRPRWRPLRWLQGEGANG